jgi:hypothetical protein
MIPNNLSFDIYQRSLPTKPLIILKKCYELIKKFIYKIS